MLIRAASIIDAKEIAQVHVASWRSTYKQLGGVEVGKKPIRINEQELIEVALGWKGIQESS